MTAVHGRFTRSQTLIQNGESCFCLVSAHFISSLTLSINGHFISGGEIDCVDKDGNTPLHIAARFGHELLINTLITSGADCTRFVCSPLRHCIINCDIGKYAVDDMVSFLHPSPQARGPWHVPSSPGSLECSR